MKLISVQSRGDRLVRVSLMDDKCYAGRIYRYKLKRRDFGAYGRHRVYTTTLYKCESTALKAAAKWLKGARI